MIRGLNLILFITSIFALIGVYGIKFQSEAVEEEKIALVRAVTQQKSELSILQADWAHYSQPSYIGSIVERHAEALNLARLEAKQFGSIAELPMRPEATDGAALDALFMALEAGIDPIGDQLAEIMEQ